MPQPEIAIVLVLALFGTACSNDAATTDDGAGASAGGNTSVTFRVTLENVSAPIPIPGGEVEPGYAPGAWLIHDEGEPLYTEGQPDRGQGLESLAEDGDPRTLLATLRGLERDGKLVDTDSFHLPPSEYEAGVLRPGASYEFSFSAKPGERLSFAGMYAQSNDVFFGTAAGGYALFDAQGRPKSGDFTEELALRDLGTEVNEQPGIGPHQAARQSAPGEGVVENGVVRPLDDGFDYPLPFVKATLAITP